jgi:hypothetical protein
LVLFKFLGVVEKVKTNIITIYYFLSVGAYRYLIPESPIARHTIPILRFVSQWLFKKSILLSALANNK